MERELTPKELNTLGDQAFYGQGQERNIEVAYTYYKQAADMNNPVGIYNLGKYYYQKAEYKHAYRLFQKASELDYQPAFIKLYDMHMQGIGVRRSRKKAFKYIKTGAELHDSATYHLIAHMYDEGLGTRRNEEKAKMYFEMSATKNHLEGMHGYGLFLLERKNKSNEHETAFYWLDKAAQHHYIPSIEYLINLYQKGHSFLRKKSQIYLEEMAFHYQELLAKTKNIQALHEVAKAYREGRAYLSINYDKAFTYYRMLHELDDIQGYLGLGQAYLYGLGTEKDYEKSIDYLEIASSRNNIEAKNLLGEVYRHGYGVDIDYQKAKGYYLGAAEKGNIEALIHLSLLHYRGQINNASKLQAFTYIKKATEAKMPNAFFWLGLYYELGVGVEKDIEKSIQTYKKAIQLGNHASRYKLANILYKEIKKQVQSKRKLDQLFIEIRHLLWTYIEHVDEESRLKAYYMLGELYLEPRFKEKSHKISRYYFECAAHGGHSKAMVRMYDIYRNNHIHEALDWLFKAIEKPMDGESYYQLALCYQEGEGYLEKNLKLADDYFKKAAKMNYAKALEKLTLQGESHDH